MKKFRPVAAVAVQRGDRWLLVRKPRAGHAWQFPQGGTDVGETLVETVARELWEECGTSLKIKIPSKPIASYRYEFPANFVRHRGKWDGAEVKFFRAEWQSGEPIPDGVELVEARWCTPSEIRELVEPEYWSVVEQMLTNN